MIKKFICLCMLSTPLLMADYEGSVQVRAAPFFPVSKRFQQVFGSVLPNAQLEANMTLNSGYELWTNADWTGIDKKQGSCCKSKINLMQGSFGLKMVFPYNEHYDAYIGIGPSFGKTILHNKSCCDHETKSKFAVGGVIKSGIRTYFSSGLFLDFFVDYLYQPVKFHHSQDVGGLKTGVGFGKIF